MVSFVYDGADRKLPAARNFLLDEIEKYLIGRATGEDGFVRRIKDSLYDLEAKDIDPNPLIKEIESMLEDTLNKPLKPYLDDNREAMSSFLRRRPEKRKDKDKKMLDEATLKNIVEGSEEFNKNLVAQLSGTVVSDIAGVSETIREQIIGQFKALDVTTDDELPTLEIETEIRFKTAKSITGENKLSFSKSNNRGNKNAHSVLTFPSDDEMELFTIKAQDLIIEYTGAEVTMIPKKGKVLIDSAIDEEGIPKAIKFSSMKKYLEDVTDKNGDKITQFKDGLQFDYKFIDDLNDKLAEWFEENIGGKDEYYEAMVQEGLLYQLMIEVSLAREEKETKLLSEKVADTIPDDDDKVKDKYSKFTAMKYRIPKAFAINPNFDVTAEEEYPLIPMKEYRPPENIKYKKGEDTEQKRTARKKLSDKLNQDRQKVVAQYNELRAATTEIEVDGNKYLLIFSDSPVYKKAEKAYNEFGFGNKKIKLMVHSFFDEKFEMLKEEGNNKFKNKALFDSDFQGQERLKYAYIDRKEEPITEAEASRIEQGDFRVVQEKYGEAFSDYKFYRKDYVKQTDIGKYADLGLNEEQRADLYYYILTGKSDVKLPSILGSPQTASQKLLDVLGISYSDKDVIRPTGATVPTPKITPAEGGADSRRRLRRDELNKQDLDDISVEKKMSTKRWIKLYETNKQAAQIYILLPLVSETSVVEDSRIIEGSEFGKPKYQATAFTADEMQVDSGEKDEDDKPIMKDNEVDAKVLYTVYLKKYVGYNLSPIRNRGQNKLMRKYLDKLGNRIIDIREVTEGY